MKRFSITIILFLSVFSATQISAQKKSSPREVIVIEFLAPNGMEERREVLINRTPKTNYQTSGGGGNGVAVGCGGCSKEELEELNRKAVKEAGRESYDFIIKAWRMGKDRSNVSFGISTDDDNCKTKKVFTVYKTKPTKIEIDCGINLVAYYGVESKEAN